MSRRFEAIVFDWDGTLVDSIGQIVACVQAAIDDQGLPARAPQAIRGIVGLGLDDVWKALYPDVEREHAYAFAAAYREAQLRINGPRPALFAGARDMLGQLRAGGYRLALATGKSRYNLDLDLAAAGLGGWFDSTRTADEARAKPHPLMLRDVMRAMKVKPRQTLMVGDTEFDLVMARRARVGALAVAGGAHDRERLAAQRPLGCVETVADVAQWLGAQD